MFNQNYDETVDTDLDPRIQIELEKLNSATDEINSLEVELDKANTTFRILLNDSIKRLKLLSKKLGGCVERARPYYEAMEVSKKAQMECQRAAVQFQRANEIHQAAKETVAVAEQRFLSKQNEWQFDNAWQEMLNHATIKVMEAETQKTESEIEHQKRALLFNEAEQKVQVLEAKLRRNISKSRAYFEEKEVCQQQLAAQKDRIEGLQRQVAGVKSSYALSLKNLEVISEEIHAKRGTIGQGVREPGVGAENDAIAVMDLEKLQSRCKAVVQSNLIEYGKDLLDDRSIGRYVDPSTDYELELDLCDLQSLGSVSATTSSAVSDEDLVAEDSDLEELKRMACEKNSEPNFVPAAKSCAVASSPAVAKKAENQTTLSANWEKQMNQTINKLSNILISLRSKDSESSENQEKY